MRSPRSLLSLTAAIALTLVACGGGGSSEGANDLSGSFAQFSSATVDGASFDSAALEGKDTVLWFWAPWCTVCRAEAPDVTATAADFEGDVEVIGVAGRGEVDEMAGFVADTGTDALTHVVDDSGQIWSDYGVAAQPAFAFINDDGTYEVFVGSLGADGLAERMAELRAA